MKSYLSLFALIESSILAGKMQFIWPLYLPRHDKILPQSLQPCKAQTSHPSYSDLLECCNFCL